MKSRKSFHYGRNRISSSWSVIVTSFVFVLGLVSTSQAGTVTFGTGANSFNMEFVTIGNPGNAPTTTGFPSGAVGYAYGIGKFEVSEDMINKFNASQALQITKDTRGVNKPATLVSWNEAARFVNWLNTSTGGFAAYNFTTGGVDDDITLWTESDTLDYDSANPYRSKRATYVLPSYHEWYKAAYYSPSGVYYTYPTGSDTAPVAVASGTGANEAVYGQPDNPFSGGPADVDQAGGLSAYGVMGLGGNVFEWEESSGNLTNSSPSLTRGIRGGSWTSDAIFLTPARRGQVNHKPGGSNVGFRVVKLSPSSPPPGEVPEPSMMVIGTLFGLGGLVAKRRLKK